MLDGRVVLVVGGNDGAGRELALGLADLGAIVGAVDASDVADRDGARQALDAAADRLGPLDGVVHVATATTAVPRPLVDTDEAAWDAGCEAILRAALFVSQAAVAHFGDRGGRLVFVVPSESLVGATGWTPYLTATEGIRALAKSAARQWGALCVTVNCVAPTAEVLWPEGAEHPTFPDPPALGRRPAMRTEVAPVVAALVGDAGASVTGATVTVDGGVMMLP